MSRVMWGAVALMVACGKGEPVTDTDTTTGNTTPTGDTAAPVETGIDPVAVGFELIAQLGSDGTLNPWFADDPAVGYVPGIVLTFADVEFFNPGSDQAAHSCSIFAPFGSDANYGGVAPLTKPDQIPALQYDPVFYWSYDAYIQLDTSPGNTDCDEIVDPKLWGEDAELLLEPFNGAHVGIGFAEMTDYLHDYWEVDAPTADFKEFLNLIEPGLFAQYIAINDKDGNWLADDWTSGILWETDEYGVPLADEAGYLTSTVTVSTLLPGADMPPGQIRSNAYWYQDFPLMDFSNLKDPPAN
jgi:hypothetical protein